MPSKRGLGLVASLFVGLAAIYAWVTPPLEGFDARAHFRYAAYLHQERRLPWPEADLVAYSYELITQPPLYFAAMALLTAPLPMDQALTYSHAAENPYHDKGLSLRQTIDLPDVTAGVLLTLWVARSVSLLGGLATVIGAYWLCRTLWPTEPWFGVAAAAIVGFNPQFLFTAVTITNDAWVPAFAVWTLYLVARATSASQPTARDWQLAGCCAGLAALTKYSCLLIALPGLLLFVRYWQRVGWRRAVGAAAWLASGALLVAGFWYGRNWLRYGALVPLDQMALALPTMRRALPLSFAQTVELIPWLWSSYWGVFVSILAPPLYFKTTTWLLIAASGGWLIHLARSIYHKLSFLTSSWPSLNPPQQGGNAPEDDGATTILPSSHGSSPVGRGGGANPQAAIEHSWFPILFVAVWLAVIFAGVLHWTRTIEFGEQGRLIHAAAPALAVLLLVGWGGWLPTAWRRWLYWLTPLGFAGLALWPLPTLIASYASPMPLAANRTFDRPVFATFAGGMQLRGVDLPNGAALGPGDRLPLTLYFMTDQVIPADYTFFLHLATDNDALLYQFDGAPVGGRHPTRQWRPGELFADPYLLTAKNVTTDTLATLSIGFYDYRDPTLRQRILEQRGAANPDRLIIGKVRVLAQPFTPVAQPSSLLAEWQEGIQLVAADVQPDETGAPHRITLRWRTSTEVQTDYTVFVQVLAADNRVLAQVDQQPHGGRTPTSTWRAGEQLTETITLPAVRTPWQRLILGLYAADGRRLPLQAPTAGQDYFILSQIANKR